MKVRLKAFIFSIIIALIVTVSPGCSEKPTDETFDNPPYNDTITEGDFEYYYVSAETGFLNPDDGVQYVDTILPPLKSGYIIVRYEGVESSLILPTATLDGTPVIGIGRWAFSHAPNLKEVIIPKGYQYIFKYAFLGLATLESVYIGSTIEYISGGIIFEQCNQLKNIQVDPDNPTYMSSENCLLKKDDMTLIAGCSESVIPQGTTVIASCAFSERKGPSEIYIPDSVVEIQSSAFFLCDVAVVYIQGQPSVVGEHAFTGCEQTIIFCDVDAQPASWHPNWIGDSSERYRPPQVVWNAKGY